MSAQPIELVFKRIMDLYNRNPKGWSVLTDHKGNVLILGPTESYRLKMVPLSPHKYTGVGLRVRGSREARRAVEGIPSWGLRPLSREETEELLSTFHHEGPVQNEIIERILGIRPVSTRELEEDKPGAILSGPVLAHSDLSAISKGQRELEKKLAREADKLFRRRYPSRAAIYG
ncbi:MAG: hypothetical protein ACE5Z5_09035 [Candidatus Bathyarchaeia archaeon]